MIRQTLTVCGDSQSHNETKALDLRPSFATQELLQKNKQLQAATSKLNDKQPLTSTQGAVKRLDEELSDMAVHIGLLQDQLQGMRMPAAEQHGLGVLAA